MFQVRVDRAIVFKPGTQPPGRRVAADVLVDVLFTDRGWIVRGAIEPAEIHSLAAGDQSFRQVAHHLKAEVPGVRKGEKGLFKRRSGNRGVKRDKLADLLGMRARIGVGYRNASVVP